MIEFICLLILLCLAIIFFITYPIFKRRLLSRNFNNFCNKKIAYISKRNKFKFLNNLNLENFNSEKLGIDNIILGNKYIYIISNYYYDGVVKGELEDNSWNYFKKSSLNSVYVDNLYKKAKQIVDEFTSLIHVNQGLIIQISLISNECDFQVKNTNSQSSFVIHYSYLKRLIKKLESRNIASIGNENINACYEEIKKQNEQGKK